MANRGEIARRIFRTLRTMGLESVAVFSDADRHASFLNDADQAIHIGPAEASKSYLNIPTLIDAAQRSGAQAIHPGYGFLSENADFADACTKAGLVFIGPSADAIRAMGRKSEAKTLATQADVPVLQGFDLSDLDEETLTRKAESLGYPILLKASAGGGGKGMRVVQNPDELLSSAAAARREAESSFGDGALIAEPFLVGARHVEIQILADRHGHVMHAHERDCSVQRRHQKILEEAPCPVLGSDLREEMGAAAVRLAQAVDYEGVGTVEFLLDAERGSFYFLEMNTRLQVEHPVTEALLGLDLVELQLEIAQGRALDLKSEDLEPKGHALEARLYAEDPEQGFLPSSGKILLWQESRTRPAGIRVDAGFETGDEVSPHYDPLLAKIIAHGKDRDGAVRQMLSYLRDLVIIGPKTNREFLIRALEHEVFQGGQAGTDFIAQHFKDGFSDPLDASWVERHAIAATFHLCALRSEASTSKSPNPVPASLLKGWRGTRYRPQVQGFHGPGGPLTVTYVDVSGDGTVRRMAVIPEAPDPSAAPPAMPSSEVRLIDHQGPRWTLEIGGTRYNFFVVSEQSSKPGSLIQVQSQGRLSELRPLSRFPNVDAQTSSAGCLAPMTGKVIQVLCKPGETVEEGQVLVVLEAMKMEHELKAHRAGRIESVHVEEGWMVDPDQVMVSIVDSDRLETQETSP